MTGFGPRRIGRLVGCCLRLAHTELSLRLRGLPKTCRAFGIKLELDGRAPTSDCASLPARFLPVARRAHQIVRRWPFGDTCLRRCVLLGWQINSLDPVLRIGIRMADGGLVAHSWLEVDGRPLDPEAARYAPLDAVEGRIR